MKTQLYNYKAKIISVYDGDTVRMDISLGFNNWLLNQSVRLFGINTPEIRGSQKLDGLISRDRLRDLIDGKEIILESHKDKTGKFGRILGTIYLDGVNINELLVREGLAVRYLP